METEIKEWSELIARYGFWIVVFMSLAYAIKWLWRKAFVWLLLPLCGSVAVSMFYPIDYKVALATWTFVVGILTLMFERK